MSHEVVSSKVVIEGSKDFKQVTLSLFRVLEYTSAHLKHRSLATELPSCVDDWSVVLALHNPDWSPSSESDNVAWKIRIYYYLDRVIWRAISKGHNRMPLPGLASSSLLCCTWPAGSV